MPENTKDNQQILNQQDLVKTCRKCGEKKPATLEFFYKNPGGKFGLTPRYKVQALIEGTDGDQVVSDERTIVIPWAMAKLMAEGILGIQPTKEHPCG